MSLDPRPRRSALYVPGSNPRAMAKARDLDADVLILDLEDAVTPDAKVAAREAVAAALAQGGYGGREVVVRVNGLGTPWGHADVAMAVAGGADAVLAPKVETPPQVQAMVAALRDGPALWCMIETPLGVLNAPAIAAASPRLKALVVGANDLTEALRARHTPDRAPLMTSLGLILLAARAHGLATLDAVHGDIADPEGFAAACRQGRDFGFDGKTLIHPSTIAAANLAFAPNPDDLALARRIVTAFAAAEAAGQGVCLVDGRLVEALHARDAERLLALAEAIAARSAPI